MIQLSRHVASGMLVIMTLTGEAMFSESSASVRCEIRASSGSAGVTLDAMISASGPTAGTYFFRVERNGKSGPTIDSGDFETTEGGPSEIKRASVALSPGESYRAELKVKWAGGSSSCSASGS